MKSKVTLITILLVFCFVLIPLLMSCNHTSGAAYIKEAGFKEQQHSLAINNPVLTAGKFHCLDITLTDDAQRISIVAYKGDVIPDVQNRTIKNYYRWEYDNGRWLDKSGYESFYIRPSQCKKNGHTYSFYIGLDARADTGDWTIKISVDNKDVYSSPLNVETIHFNILLFTIYTNGFKLDRNDLPEFFKKHRKINHQEQTAANKESLDDIEASIDHFPGARSSVSQIKAFAIPVKKTPLYDELVDKLIKEPPSVQETDDDEEIENCYEAEKTIVVDPHLKVSTKKGVIPPPTRKINHLSFFSVGVAFLVAFLLFSLAFMPLITSLDVSIDSNSPVISSFTLSLDEVVNGDTIFLNVSTYNGVGISSVTADMGGIETIQLSLIDNSTSDHLWQAVWTVHDVNPGDYFTTITALDNESNSYSAQLEWTVLSQDSDEEGGSDTNQTETTNEEDSNTTTDVSDFENEINSGNDTLTNETDGSILNETFNVENESSNETVFDEIVNLSSNDTIPVSGYINITAFMAKELIDSEEDIFILDVRRNEEYNSGYIEGALSIPLIDLGCDSCLQNMLDEHKNESVIVYCKTGIRSKQACDILLENGFTTVYNLVGGINGWIGADFPLTVVSQGNSVYSMIDEGLNNGMPVFLFFYMDACGHCQEQMPIINELNESYSDRIVFIYVERADDPDSVEGFGVTGYPTMFLIVDKDEDSYIYKDFSGFKDRDTLVGFFDIALYSNDSSAFDGWWHGDIEPPRPLGLPLKVAARISHDEDAQVIIEYKDGSNFSEVTAFLESVGFVKTAEISSKRFVAGIMSRSVYEEIKFDDSILAVYPDINFTVFLNESLPLIRYDEAVNEFGVTGSGKRICILDTGIDSSLVNYSYGYDFVDDDPIPDDEYGHGTSVASVIKSVAPDAELIVAKVIGGSGVGFESTVLEGLEWCIAQNPDVISFSIGSQGTCSGFCDSNLVAGMANDAVDSGIFVVAASGNDGTKNLTSPACGSKVFSVGATDDYDNITSFSNVNPTLDMFAPGVDIETAVGSGSGTSFSAPHVSGAALLVLENENLTPASLKYRLRSTGKPINYTYNETLSLEIARLDVYNTLANNKTMEPYNYSWWWQGILGDGEGYEPSDQSTYYFDSYDVGEAWATLPQYMIDGITSNYASTIELADAERLLTNTYTGGGSGTISKVEVRVFGYFVPRGWIDGTPIFGGAQESAPLRFDVPPNVGDWTIYADITSVPFAPSPWTWDDIQNLDFRIVAAGLILMGDTLYCSKVEIRVTYTVNAAPTQSAQKIWNSTTAVEKNLNATDVDLYPTSFNVTINDADGDNMNITIMTNESGTWTVVNQTSGSGLSNDTYSYTNTSWVDTYNTKYWISFNVTDGTEWCNETYNFTTNYAPTQTGESPTNQSTGISLTPQLYVICNDADGGDTLTATWSSNSSGTWYDFATNNSISPGTNITQPNANFSAYSMKYYWKVNLTDGTDWNNATYHFTTLANVPPEIGIPSVDNSTVGYGYNVTINVSVWDNNTGVSQVKCNVTYPDSTSYNFTMANTGGAYYEKEINLTDTWQLGWHNYTIWATDGTLGNTSSQYSFNVSAQCDVTVQTEKDSYGANEYVNLTDPPDTIGDNPVDEGPFDNTEDLGYEFLDDNSVLHIWNQYNDYYFNVSNDLQFTNHYNEYWTHNVLMLGYYDGDEWNLIYRTDELSNFNKNITGETDNYINTTLWKDLSYGNYDFRLTIRYHLSVNDSDLTIIPYIKNLGQAIPYVLGFGWELKDIQIDATEENDYIFINRTIYFLNQSLNLSFTDLGNHTQFYLQENMSYNTFKSLYLKWDKSLNYRVTVKNQTGQYNAPVTLFIRIGTLGVGQEKFTKMHWLDVDTAIYYFNSYESGEAWNNDPQYMVDGITSNYAYTEENADAERMNTNNYTGDGSGTISIVEARVFGYYVQRGTIDATPIFGGTEEGAPIPFIVRECVGLPCEGDWTDWLPFSEDPMAPDPWTWDDIRNLDFRIVAAGIGVLPGDTVYCSKVEIRVTYTPNNAPTQSNQKIWNATTSTEWNLNATEVSLTPTCFNVTVNDTDADYMNVTVLTNESGSWTIVNQTTSGMLNGTYYAYNTSWVNARTTYYISFNLTDGTDWCNETYHFTTYIQSKINNTGTTNCKGYLLMQIHYNDSGSWYTVENTIDETGTRTINASEYLKLDAIFNGTVYTSTNLTNGTGEYRVYVAFRDKFGSVLKNDDDTYMNASYTFNYTAAADTDSPEIVVNFAGNLSDSGGPYWRPPGESVALSGVWENGYYTNLSKQSEGWIYINCTITDATGVGNVWLNWLNETTWTNWTYAFTNVSGNYWEINTSNNFSTASGYNYSFNIVANDTASPVNSNTTWWNKTGIGGSLTRRWVQLNHTTQTNITYTPFYLYNATYDTGDDTKKDRLQHDQGPYSVLTTGFLYDDVPTDTLQHRSTGLMEIGWWFDENTCIEPFNLENIYFHVWWRSNDDIFDNVSYKKSRSYMSDGNPDQSYASNASNAKSNITIAEGAQSNKYYLEANILNFSSSPVSFTDNNIFELYIYLKGGHINSISNRSFTSFCLFNVPDNNTLNTSYADSDSDSLSDWEEIYSVYTNPFHADTDNDGINDYWEDQAGSDPNNYTETFNVSNAPLINSYNLSNSTGSKLNSLTGLLDVNNEYYFKINITDEDGWANIQYVNITAQYDNGSESTTYNQSNNSGGNLNMFLQYANTSGTGIFSMKWPDDEAELIPGNCSETIINSTTRVINISFKPKSQVRYANTTGGWDTTQNATNDLNSWNFNITVVDNSNAKAWKIDEYGVYKYTFIEPNQNWVDVTAAPGRNDTSSIVAVNYSSNYDFNMTIWFTGNLTNQTKGTTILIANNVDILNNTDPNDDIDTGDITFNGIGEANAVDIFNTSGTFPKNNASQTVDVQFNVRIPIGTMWGVYTAHINVKIFQKT